MVMALAAGVAVSKKQNEMVKKVMVKKVFLLIFL